MRFYEVDILRPDLPRHWTGHFVAEHTWTLPGVECSTCGETWSGQQAFPSVDLSDLPRQALLREPRVVPYDTFPPLVQGLAPRLPQGITPEPGMQLGPLRGTSQGAFGPLTTQEGWDLLVREDALTRLEREGIHVGSPVRAELQGLGPGAPLMYELELPTAGLLDGRDVLEGPRCRTCGWREVRISPEHALEATLLPTGLDAFRPVNATTYIVVTERFVQAVHRLGVSDVVFRELPVAAPSSR
ncbi:double-CXXCG motif protein [Corallococcus sp. BB11-1]|uniref:SitI6 family double-CXXCG motif immunity protein n=1 Tax=Corallococcus sp. BB11-1 TaxID=2996783 RepID=UPI0022721A33|nr:double-CXXCG motif protein [Corallococcus sp. BB11-1]MCY1032899.1 double-CXXCG motif protein [Corallococcus sp. BB11-1]